LWRREGHGGIEMRWSCQIVRNMFGIPGHSAMQRELLRALPKPTLWLGAARRRAVGSLWADTGRPEVGSGSTRCTGWQGGRLQLLWRRQGVSSSRVAVLLRWSKGTPATWDPAAAHGSACMKG
jgi:hypothetical protein